MTPKTPEQFKEKVEELNLRHWNIHDCSICGYPCGYIFREGQVLYDTGCDCSWGGERPSDYQDIANHYNMQPNEEYIKKMNEFWHFES